MIIPFLPCIEADDSGHDLHKEIEQQNVLFYSNSINEHYCSPHISPFGIIFSHYGTSSVKINNKRVNIWDNSCRILNRGTDFEIELSKTNFREIALLFFKKQQLIDVAQVNDFDQNELLGFPNKRHEIRDDLFIERNYFSDDFLQLWISRYIANSVKTNQYTEAEKITIIYEMLQYLIDLNAKSIKEIDNLKSVKYSTRKELYKRLYLACDIMRSTFSENTTLNQLAQTINMNPYHFLRTFKELFGTTPHAYLTHIRLQKAASLLKESKLSITEICSLCGFESVPSFSNLFKSRFMSTPSSYRNS